jgi:hypothetical protein
MKFATIAPSLTCSSVSYRLSFVALSQIITVIDRSVKNRHRKGIWLVNPVAIVGILF